MTPDPTQPIIHRWLANEIAAHQAWLQETGTVVHIQGIGADQIEILDYRVEDGGNVQIGDYTWDHEDASIAIVWRDRETGRRDEHSIRVDIPALVRGVLRAEADLLAGL